MKATKVVTIAPRGVEPNLPLLQAAARLGVSPFTLRSWARYQGRIAYLRMGRRLVFRLADLEAFERANLTPARPARAEPAR